MLYSPIHATRRFQLDDQLPKKLDYLRDMWRDTRELAREKSGDPIVGMGGMPLNLPQEACEDFLTLQSCMFNHMRTMEDMSGFLQFWDGPRQIFSFDRALAEALAHTDVGDVPWEALKLPYDEFYVHFGTIFDDAAVQFEDRRYVVEGAYVRRQGRASAVPGFGGEDTLHITLTTCLVSPGYEEAMTRYPEGYRLGDPDYRFMFIGKAGDTLQDALDRGNESNLAFAQQRDQMLLKSCLEFAEEIGMDTRNAEAIPAYEGYFERGCGLMNQCTPLLLNCIAYLTHVDEPEEMGYPPGTPEKMLRRFERANDPRRREVLAKQFEQRGYTRVKFVCHVGLTAETEEHVPTGKTVRPHWRRGHWRLQPWGPQRSRLRLTWVKPTLVRGDKGNPEHGRLYQVDEQSR